MNNKSIKIIFLGTLLFLLFPQPADAYLDPGTGSYLFQLLIAGFLTSMLFIKSIIKKIKEFFKHGKK